VSFDGQDANETQRQLREVLRQYPPGIQELLRLDPSLATREDYLGPYPALAGFLAQHPEVLRNPSYFFGTTRFDTPYDNRARALNLFGDILAGAAFLIGFVTVVGAITWIVRQIIEHRRWVAMTRIQTNAHSKLLDRLTANEDLLAYIQSPAGRHFLESAPIPIEQTSRTISAPVGRILWSVQAGIVMMVVGVGMWFVKNTLFVELEEAIYVVSILAISLGAGFVLSALVAYVLSQHLGLLESPKT
jgi:hypothetical protein